MVRRGLAVWLVVVLGVGGVTAAWGALAPGDYAITHLAGGIITIPDAASRGRGGVRTGAMDLLSPELMDPTCSSIAQLCMLRQPLVYGEYAGLDGPDASSIYRSYRVAAPLSDKDAVLVHRLVMGGGGEVGIAPGVSGHVAISEHATAIWYGRGDADFAWGIGVAPQLQTHTSVSAPGRGQLVKIDSRLLTRPRARFSLFKKLNERVRVGADTDLFDETARYQANTAQGPVRIEESFDSRIYRVGGSYLIDCDTVVGADYQWGTFRGPGKDMGMHDLYLGAERRLGPGFVGRIGSYSGKLSLGAGYRRGQGRIDAAWVGGVAKDADPLFGANPTLWTVGGTWWF